MGEGTDYAFSLDGGPPRPDPRSRWQPYGVHGPSRRVEPSSWSWRSDDREGLRLRSAVFYELHVGTFSPEGTFDGAIERLDHLVELGVTAVSLMPVNAFPGRHGWGYDGVGLYAVHDPYGGPAGLQRFVDACHGRGLGVVLDVVYNHLGPSGNYLGEFGPYFTDRYATPWGEAPNLDGGGSDEVRRFFIDNALMWLRDYRIDGLRLDAVHAIVDTSAVHLLEELAIEVDALSRRVGRPLKVVAESDLNDPRLLWSRERGGYGLDAQWSDDFHHALHAALTGERAGYYADFGRMADIGRALRNAYVYDGRHSGFRDRRHGRPATGLDGHRFLGYLQNHDQVGNRAEGDRIDAVAGPDLQKVGAALVLTAPFVPLVFQGEEWAASSPFQYFTDHTDPELGRAVSRGRRAEFAAFGWEPDAVPDPQDPATFVRSRLRWDERSEPYHEAMESWYRRLIAFRRRHGELQGGPMDRVRTARDEDARTLAVRRGEVVVACNLGDGPTEVPVPGGWGDPVEVLASADGWRPGKDGGVVVPG
ncbi:MAG: malto-oligosyltrehalose trehalohydrolase, partial [Gemmatimonadetes bacterium]|nr:malto-oligosyltrehalose trehalohydrolase [Gemmatimonadota bacterium]NIQ54902.1 malto-oligosyltrehalose trehalohydrolase [Gemmatimonadota bacterium]NIU75099.1 malto-oligosyltrehalose trehalohydrolase [Gammaproteobacteria bacterium]NIX44930.1 malto-oligosyltrehalose trehalohydrolase [Gemmatimonadota bacterium]NIY09163.1 malto-oligosyltrehalose trehalohydrolase [Gemmatimonadota bacterium]